MPAAGCSGEGAKPSLPGPKSPHRPFRDVDVRRHHEEIAILPALSLLLPFAGALWLRIVTGRTKARD